MAVSKTDVERVGVSSVLAGQIGGLVMALVLFIVFAVFLGRGFFYPTQVIASFFLGDRALAHLTFGSFLLGVLIHQLGPALFWSVIFGFAVASRRTPLTLNDALVVGFFVGGIAAIVDVYILVPPLFRALQGHNIWWQQVPRFWDWTAHLVYGVSMGAAYVWLRDTFAKRVAIRPQIPAAA